jgi:hypothetical protein
MIPPSNTRPGKILDDDPSNFHHQSARRIRITAAPTAIPVVSLDSEACRHKTRITTHARNIDANRHMMANKPV